MTNELTHKFYHERQRRQLCLLHALNNLMQCEEFTQAELDCVCESLDDRRWWNAHRSCIGLGNYDANILVAALNLRGLSAVWFDSRLSVSRINHDVIIGYIFNVPSASYIPFYNGRHWFSVIRIGSAFYNLDSKLSEVEKISDFIVFANGIISQGNQLFLVTKQEDEGRSIIKEE